jgi:hypothetical protein
MIIEKDFYLKGIQLSELSDQYEAILGLTILVEDQEYKDFLEFVRKHEIYMKDPVDCVKIKLILDR